MSERVAVQLDLPREAFDRLRLIAHSRGESVTSLLQTAATRISTLSPEISEVIMMVLEGFTDSEIARQLNLTNAQVARQRQVRGYPANSRRKQNRSST